MKISQSLSIGLAMFAMFFGAGNVIFPLLLGSEAGHLHFYASLGLILTGVLIPLSGVFAMILYQGNTLQFFGQIGKLPGLILALFIITLLGPLGSTPRCIALSYTTFKSFIPDLSLFWFSLGSIILIFTCTIKKNKVVPLLGFILTPLLLFSLLAIILLGIFTSASIPINEQSIQNTFMKGLMEGYNTMDLLAAFFFSASIFNLVKERSDKNHIKLSLTASTTAALLLAVVYAGFSFLAAKHGINGIPSDQLLTSITFKLAGPYAGLLVCFAVGLACLTTAIALISIFSDFVQKNVFKEKISYGYILAFSLLITFIVSTLEFNGISAFLGPILEICYPGLIILTFSNILIKLKRIKSIT